MPYNGSVPTAEPITPTKRLITPTKAKQKFAERAALELVPDKPADKQPDVIEPADPGFVELVPEPGSGGRIVPYLKRSRKVEGEILGRIAIGMPIERAAIAAGISHRSVDRWKQMFKGFLAECRRAEAVAEGLLLEAAKSPNGVGSRWLLACRFGYVPVQRQEVTGADGGPVKQLTIVQHLMGKLSSESDG